MPNSIKKKNQETTKNSQLKLEKKIICQDESWAKKL